MNDNLQLFTVEYLAGLFHTKWIKWDSHIKKTILGGANNEIWAFKQKLGFEKTFNCHRELDSFLISRKINWDINKCGTFSIV